MSFTIDKHKYKRNFRFFKKYTTHFHEGACLFLHFWSLVVHTMSLVLRKTRPFLVIKKNDVFSIFAKFDST